MTNKTIRMEKTYLGIELGSTRIKAVLIDDSYMPIASGSFTWENAMENGYWTYSEESIHEGLRACYRSLKADVYEKYGITVHTVGAIGISAMMHGYLALSGDKKILVPFRTWRNTTTKEAAEELTELFRFNVPQRWSIAHLYQAIKRHEPHVKELRYLTTLSGYIHFLLTDSFTLGIGDASGMFPVSGDDYDEAMLCKFRQLEDVKDYPWDIKTILPEVRKAGDRGAFLTEAGAAFLDPDGDLAPGILLCPPEGDAGTGMVATNCILPETGDISAGTSVFAIMVLKERLKAYYPQIDIAATPDGSPVAMVQCNNCCCELDAWTSVFAEFSRLIGKDMDMADIYALLYRNAVNGDCRGMTAYNYLSGEHIAEVSDGHPMFFRSKDSELTLAGFMKAQLYSAFSTLAMGFRMLLDNERISPKSFLAHGGLFKTPKVAQQILANALNTPVSVMDTAGEGGAWGIALLAAFAAADEGLSLGDWLTSRVFDRCSVMTLSPDEDGVKEFDAYLEAFKTGLAAQKVLETK